MKSKGDWKSPGSKGIDSIKFQLWYYSLLCFEMTIPNFIQCNFNCLSSIFLFSLGLLGHLVSHAWIFIWYANRQLEFKMSIHKTNAKLSDSRETSSLDSLQDVHNMVREKFVSLRKSLAYIGECHCNVHIDRRELLRRNVALTEPRIVEHLA